MSADLTASPINTSYDDHVVKGVQGEIPLAGVRGVSPSFKTPPKIRGYRELIKTISAPSYDYEESPILADKESPIFC